MAGANVPNQARKCSGPIRYNGILLFFLFFFFVLLETISIPRCYPANLRQLLIFFFFCHQLKCPKVKETTCASRKPPARTWRKVQLQGLNLSEKVGSIISNHWTIFSDLDKVATAFTFTSIAVRTSNIDMFIVNSSQPIRLSFKNWALDNAVMAVTL